MSTETSNGQETPAQEIARLRKENAILRDPRLEGCPVELFEDVVWRVHAGLSLKQAVEVVKRQLKRDQERGLA